MDGDSLKNMKKIIICFLLLTCLFTSSGHAFYNASAGRWLSRDPIEEKGGLNLYAFVCNRPVNDLDPFGHMRLGDLTRQVDAWETYLQNIRCCCKEKTGLQATITGTASGQQVTDTIETKTTGGGHCPAVILKYYWWDCVTAQGEYDSDPFSNKPTGRQAWQDYGWHEGENPQTQSHEGWEPHWWDIWDKNHWNWQAAVLYMSCGKDGRMHAKLAFSNALEWTWSNGAWTSPHNGVADK